MNNKPNAITPLPDFRDPPAISLPVRLSLGLLEGLEQINPRCKAWNRPHQYNIQIAFTGIWTRAVRTLKQE